MTQIECSEDAPEATVGKLRSRINLAIAIAGVLAMAGVWFFLGYQQGKLDGQQEVFEDFCTQNGMVFDTGAQTCLSLPA